MAASVASRVGDALTDGEGLLVVLGVGRASTEEPQAARPRAEAADSTPRSWAT